MTEKKLRVLLLGDVSGPSGMGALFLGLSSAVKENDIDFVICNGENAADGFGITIDDYNRMKSVGVDVITSGIISGRRMRFTLSSIVRTIYCDRQTIPTRASERDLQSVAARVSRLVL